MVQLASGDKAIGHGVDKLVVGSFEPELDAHNSWDMLAVPSSVAAADSQHLRESLEMAAQRMHHLHCLAGSFLDLCLESCLDLHDRLVLGLKQNCLHTLDQVLPWEVAEEVEET